MSPQESLYADAHARFRVAFGEPTDVLGGGEQWTLRPSRPFRHEIHVLLNGTPEKPGVWVFDPHDSKNGVENSIILEQRQIGDLITLIQGRLDFANRKRGHSNPLQT